MGKEYNQENKEDGIGSWVISCDSPFDDLWNVVMSIPLFISHKNPHLLMPHDICILTS